MAQKRIGKRTVRLSEGVNILSAASVVGKMESEGPLGELFDKCVEDGLFGEDSWEMAESKFVKEAMGLAMEKASMDKSQMDYVLCGDLLNQCMASAIGIKEFNIPFLGLFGACSTMGEGMDVGAMLIDGGFADHILVGASSHFCSAEKQFRSPLPLGTQRPPTSTWTVTGDGAVVLGKRAGYPVIKEVVTGKIVDMGVTDPNNMGAAMAPAAAELIHAYFQDTGRKPEDFDVIATGDLGDIGRTLVVELLEKEGIHLDGRFTDCGLEIYHRKEQEVYAGGSGCACAAVTFCAYYYPQLLSGKIKRMLFIPTGALMSQTSSQQGQSTLGIAHGVVIEGVGQGGGSV